MGSFFFAAFGLIWLCIVLGSENKAKQEYETYVSGMQNRNKKWWRRVNNGPLNNYQFHEKLRCDRKFTEQLLKECNDVLNSIPEMDGIQLWNTAKYETATILEMVYNAKTGDIPAMWTRGYIKLYEFTDGFPRKPSSSACRAFMNWYQNELRKNGYAEARIVDIQSKGHTIGWRFTEGAATYETIKRELYIDD